MDSSLSQKSWVQAGFIFIGFLIIWKIVEQALAGGFNVMTGRDLESFGRFDWYILQPLMLILAPMIIGWLMVRYTESYMELVIVSILSTIALHLLEYAILDRLFDFPVFLKLSNPRLPSSGGREYVVPLPNKLPKIILYRIKQASL